MHFQEGVLVGKKSKVDDPLIVVVVEINGGGHY